MEKKLKMLIKKKEGKKNKTTIKTKTDQFYYFVEFDSLQDVDLLIIFAPG